MGFFQANKFIDGYSKLKIGMSKEEVLNLFGEPNGQKVKNGEETLIWTNSEFKGALRGEQLSAGLRSLLRTAR